MKSIRILFLIFLFIFSKNMFSEESLKERQQRKDKKYEDAILKAPEEVRTKAILRYLKISNVANKKHILDEINKIQNENKNKQLVQEVRYKGLKNIEKFDGWDVAMRGILMVFVGLTILFFAILTFNYLFGRKLLTNRAENKLDVFEEVRKETITNIPEEEVVVIAAALEIYKRLYGEGYGVSFNISQHQNEKSSWKSGIKYGHRQ